MRGLAGCGKTTAARKTGLIRVNRDDFRRMFYGRVKLTPEEEDKVTIGSHTAIGALLVTGNDAICDDTNLNPDHLAQLLGVARAASAEVEIWDMTDVPVGVCVFQDLQRTGDARVGEAVIRGMYDRYLAGRPPMRSVPGCTVRSFDPATGSFAASRI